MSGYVRDAGYHRFCADVIDGMEGRQISPSENSASMALNSLYKAGYRTHAQVVAADDAELLKLRGVTQKAVAAIKGRPCDVEVDRFSFECDRCGSLVRKEGAFKASVTVRDREPGTGRMGVSEKHEWKLCLDCGKAALGALEEVTRR